MADATSPIAGKRTYLLDASRIKRHTDLNEGELQQLNSEQVVRTVRDPSIQFWNFDDMYQSRGAAITRKCLNGGLVANVIQCFNAGRHRASKIKNEQLTINVSVRATRTFIVGASALPVGVGTSSSGSGADSLGSSEAWHTTRSGLVASEEGPRVKQSKLIIALMRKRMKVPSSSVRRGVRPQLPAEPDGLLEKTKYRTWPIPYWERDVRRSPWRQWVLVVVG
ncbi:hypothetical protein C8R44DRAFT_751107 [Mycena epipterygia]|nr:hypothetical protein C8R44DRAFT_751107 [Mycena epipterygia]